MPIIIRKAKVTPVVRPNPSLSLNDIQSMINSVLERQARSSVELMHRLIEEWDGKNLMILMSILLLVQLILLKPICKQVPHLWVTLQCQTHQSSQRTTFTAEPSLMVRLLLLGHHNKLWPACSGYGTCTPHLAFPCQTLARPHIPPGVMAGHMQTTMITMKSRTPP
jgi:hypothetical protein